MSSATKSVLVWAAPTLCGLLLAGNIFFISRLVEEFYGVREIVWQLRQQVAVMQAQMESNRLESARAESRRR